MNSKDKWNTKHKDKIAQIKATSPNPRLKNLSAYINGGTALDLACGLGGNSLFLAERHYQVLAIDISDVAINYLQEQVDQHKFNIQPQICDLTNLKKHNWQNYSFDLVVITYYLDRSLFPIVKNMLKEGGYFFMETFYHSPNSENPGVSNQYKLQSKELLMEFKNWKVLFYEEHEGEGRQTIFCQKSNMEIY